MAQSLNLQIKGLITAPSELAQGDGALDVAENINIDAPNVASSRRGFYPSTATAGGRVDWLGRFESTLCAYVSGTGYLRKYSGGAWANIGAVVPAEDSAGFRQEQYNGSMFVADDSGVLKLDSITGTLRAAGVPAGIDVVVSLTGASGFMSTATQVSYRAVFGYTDADGVVVLGAPSARADLANSTGGSRNVTVRAYIPNGVASGYFLQVYRAGQSSGAAVQADDEMGLVYEVVLVAGDITAGYVEFTDIVIDSLRGATIYTAPSQEGIGASNDRPPRAADMTNYKGCMFYANTAQPHVLYLNVVAAGSGAGGVFAVDDTVTINGVTYTAKASENAASRQFKVDTTITDVASSIQQIAMSLVKIVNLYSGNTEIDAFYISGYDDIPGKMAFRRSTFINTTFYAVASRGAAWSPVLSSSGTDCASSADRNAARVYFSKPGQPEAVPYGYYFQAGSDDWPIIRIIALRDSVFCFKTNGEVWRVSGEDPGSFSIRVHDSSTTLYGPRTAAVFNNEIYCFSDQGVVAVSDAGVGIKSFPIDTDMQRYLSTTVAPTFTADSFGVAYDSDRSYLLFTGDKVWRYNVLTGAWTNWTISATAGFNDVSNDVLMYVNPDDDMAWVERKTYTVLDFCDDRIDLTITSAPGGLDFDVADASGLAVGYGVYQGTTAYGVITAINSLTVTLDRIVSLSAGIAYGCKPIDCSLRWGPIHGGNPGVMKHFREFTAFFRAMSDEFSCYCTNNFDESETGEIVIDPAFSGSGWGDFPWGEVAWGGEATGAQQSRVGWPVRSCRALWARLKIMTSRPFTSFELMGVSMIFEPVSNRFSRG